MAERVETTVPTRDKRRETVANCPPECMYHLWSRKYKIWWCALLNREIQDLIEGQFEQGVLMHKDKPENVNCPQGFTY